MKIETGEKLDIDIYTTDSLLIATPTDGHTSVMIFKQQNEMPCLVPQNEITMFITVMLYLIPVLLCLLVIINQWHCLYHSLGVQTAAYYIWKATNDL